VQGLPELGVLAHAVAVAADRDEMTLMHEAIDERGGHDLVAEDAEMRTVFPYALAFSKMACIIHT